MVDGSPSERALRARISAHRLHALGKTNTQPARNAFLARFEREVDPDRQLPSEERVRRAEHLRKAYFTELAMKSARARRSAAMAPRTVSVYTF